MNATLSFKANSSKAAGNLQRKASARQVRERVEVMAALRESEAASAQGKVISHDEVVRRFRSWHRK